MLILGIRGDPLQDPAVRMFSFAFLDLLHFIYLLLLLVDVYVQV